MGKDSKGHGSDPHSAGAAGFRSGASNPHKAGSKENQMWAKGWHSAQDRHSDAGGSFARAPLRDTKKGDKGYHAEGGKVKTGKSSVDSTRGKK